MFHEMAAEHRAIMSLVSQIGLLDPGALSVQKRPAAAETKVSRKRPAAAICDVTPVAPCPRCLKVDVAKKIGNGRVRCRCGRTYNPKVAPMRQMRCPEDGGQSDRHHVVTNGYDAKGVPRFLCQRCAMTFSAPV